MNRPRVVAGALDRRLVEHIRRAGLFPDGGAAVLAVSGGPDSLALLDLLHATGPELSLALAVAHVDHGILGDSARVAVQVEAAAARYGLPFHVERLRLGPEASETRARGARYGALRAVQQRLGARYLVTGHHADDQIETVLYRLLRGSGIRGLAGIASVGPRGLVRPLLPFRRSELADWWTSRFPDPGTRPPVHQDPSNADVRHDRAWVRGQLLPLLRQRFGERLDRALLELASHAARDRDAWAALLRTLPDLDFTRSDGVVEVALAPLVAAPSALAGALVQALAREGGWVLSPSRSRRVWEFLRSAGSGRRSELGAGVVAEIAFGRLRLRRGDSEATPRPAAWGEDSEGRVAWGHWELTWRPEAAGPAQRRAWSTWVEPGRGVVRAAARGERVVPLGGTGRRAVSRLLMEARVPRSAREGYPVIVRGEEPVWVPGVCRADVAVPVPGAAALRLEVRRHSFGVGAADAVG